MKVRRGAYVTEVSEKRHLVRFTNCWVCSESDAAQAVALLANEAQLAALAQLHQQLEAATDKQSAF